MTNISVVIPTLNEEDNLPNCLKRLSGQLIDGDEVIVVDGGSEDGTVELANRFGCDVYIAEGSGIGMAREIGTDKATNEVIAQTDADALPPDGWVDRIRYHFSNEDNLSVLWGNIEDVNGVPIRNLVGKFSTPLKGASGNNTAYSKSKFEETKGYPDISFMEDTAMINRLSKTGKAIRDKDLIMVMNMDRKRYQTIPLTLIGLGSIAAGSIVDWDKSDLLQGAGIGLVGTEFLHEGLSDTPLHHDQVGSGVVMLGNRMGSRGGRSLMGTGAGIVAHHIATEGISAFPSELMENTDKIVGGKDG